MGNVLSRFFDQRNRLVLRQDDFAGDRHFADLLLIRHLIHQVEHQVLDDHAQAAGADLALERGFGNRFERVVGEAQLHVLVLEQLHVLARDRIARLRQDLDQRRLVELVQRADDRQAADELRNQAVLDQVLRLELLERGADVAAAHRLHVGLEAERLLADAAVDGLIEADERGDADEQDVAGVDLEELLVRMLASALRRDVGDRALENLQQRLLHAFARHVAGDRRVLVLTADLVDFVDVNDPLLALLDVAAGGLQQLEDDVLDVLADVPGFGQRRRVDDGEGDREQLGEGLGEQRLAGAGRADQEDVALGQLDVVAAARLLLNLDALVVVVHRDGEFFLRPFLADDVFVEELLDFLRVRQRRAGAAVLEAVVVRDDVVADLNALVADEHRRARNQLPDVVLVLVAEGASQDLGFASLFHHVVPRVVRTFRSADAGLKACTTHGYLRPFADDIVNNTVFLALVRRHDVVALGVVLDPLDVLAGMVDQDLVEPLTHAQDLSGRNINIGRLAA